jgi:hypothetical protein
MALKIDQELIDTADCEKDFACLSGEKEDLPEVTRSLGYNMVVVDGPTPSNCQYSVNYGGLHACKCPVRVAIFNTYGK